MPRGGIIGSIRGEHKARKGGLTEDLNRGRRKVKSAVMRNLPYEITSTEVTSAEMYDGWKKKKKMLAGVRLRLSNFSRLSPRRRESAPRRDINLENEGRKTKMQQITLRIAHRRSERPCRGRVERVAGKRGEKFQFQEHYYFH